MSTVKNNIKQNEEVFEHFAKVAPKYRNIRTTDLEPIFVIKSYLKDLVGSLPEFLAADVGCGAGRYDLELFNHLGRKLSLFCLDANQHMLKELKEYLTKHNIKKFSPIECSASDLPLSNQSMNCVFTFNAIHHFEGLQFFKEAYRVLQHEGFLFIYTRTRSQNNRNIWGKYFPTFSEKETRLYETAELEQMLTSFPKFKLIFSQNFIYPRQASFKKLINLVQNYHYSTFGLYTEEELNQSISLFKKNLETIFDDLENITWFDENILLVIKKH